MTKSSYINKQNRGGGTHRESVEMEMHQHISLDVDKDKNIEMYIDTSREIEAGSDMLILVQR